MDIVEYHDTKGEVRRTVLEYYGPQLDSNTQHLIILNLQASKDSEFSFIHEGTSLRALSVLSINPLSYCTKIK